MQENLEILINNLYDMIQDAMSVPFGDKCLIEKDRALDILDEIRESLPSDLKMARDIVEKRNEYMAAGRRDAEAILKQAEEQAVKLVSEHEVTIEARRKAAEMINLADAKSKELRRAATIFCDDTFRDAEKEVNSALEELKRARQKLQTIKK